MINDTFGHSEGSAAITTTAEILGRTFRDSDVVARIGGDEFAILAQNASDNETTIIVNRLEENLRTVNAQRSQPYQLSVSVGAVMVHPDNTLSVDDLVCKADAAMYEHKRSKKPRADALEDKPLPARITRHAPEHTMSL